MQEEPSVKRWITLLLCLLLIFAVSCTGSDKTAQNGAESAELTPLSSKPMETYDDAVGDLSFDAVTLDGRPIKAGIIREYDLEETDCWADWCGPCVKELPELERVHREHPNVLFIGLLCNPQSLDDAKAILKDAGVTYAAMEPSGSLGRILNRFDAIPATVFFDNAGHEIADPIIGARSYAEWNSIVEGLLP